jgi:hypothetical protein
MRLGQPTSTLRCTAAGHFKAFGHYPIRPGTFKSGKSDLHSGRAARQEIPQAGQEGLPIAGCLLLALGGVWDGQDASPVLSLATGMGSAKTISRVTLGNPTIITATAHGFSVGDIVTITSVGGATTVNGTWVVTNKTTNTFAINLDTTGGAAYTSGGTATPVSWTPIINVRTFTGFVAQSLNGMSADAVEDAVKNSDSAPEGAFTSA